MEETVIVTTTPRAGSQAVQVAEHLAARFGWPYLPAAGRHSRRIVVTRDGCRYVVEGRTVFAFHPGLAVVRIKRLLAGATDPLLAVSALGAGDSFLDCTLGLGQDAIVASHQVGEQGKVLGVEAVREVAAVVQAGLQVYGYPFAAVRSAMRRVSVVAGDHAEFLAEQPDRSWDVVYFDPLFRTPVTSSTGIALLRGIARETPVSEQAVREALRVARRCVVLKERATSPEFARLGFAVAWRGRRVALGVIAR